MEPANENVIQSGMSFKRMSQADLCVMYLGFANWSLRNQLGEPNLLLNRGNGWQQLYWGTVDDIERA